MRLFLLTAVTMTAFAANSVLNRAALLGGHADWAAFAAIRLLAGAAALAGILWLRGRRPRPGGRGSVKARITGAASLALYMLGFSAAYVALGAGPGALILFGGVQITMFAGALLAGEAVPVRRWAGAAVAFAGLSVLMWPGAGAQVPLWPALAMAAAAAGWGVYSLAGRGAADPLGETARNFALACLPAMAVAAWMALAGGLRADGAGVALAVVSGAVTSGLGYALWYAILPALGAARAGIAQLSAPVIAAAGGIAFLGEAPTLRFAAASVLVLGGVALGTLAPGVLASGGRARRRAG